jgi:hypothetical protein
LPTHYRGNWELTALLWCVKPLISDMLAEELEIVVESFGRGLWRFRSEAPGKLRPSERR